ncbi:HNH endonuclease [Listeria phage P70]|uniref:HNH endonuclease n=1 Tax=Listeria phage P70 TaxID=1225800 RepID=J9QQH0_9CAUD|nr:HNH endonuclease [Listeria phage P70]AFQ96231.1 HNH endonuclease [Listeria phage P70]
MVTDIIKTAVLNGEVLTGYVASSNGTIFKEEQDFQNNTKLVPLEQTANIEGYMQVSIKGKRVFVHRIIGETLLHNPVNYAILNHIDHDKTNNNLLNLQWCDSSHNMKEYYRHNKDATAIRGKRPIEMFKDGEAIAWFESVTKAHEVTGIPRRSISKVINKKRPSVHGFTFEVAEPMSPTSSLTAIVYYAGIVVSEKWDLGGKK